MTSYNNELSTIYDIKQFNTQLQSITASSERPFQVRDIART